jgi:hypothetical protein
MSNQKELRTLFPLIKEGSNFTLRYTPVSTGFGRIEVRLSLGAGVSFIINIPDKVGHEKQTGISTLKSCESGNVIHLMPACFRF